MKKLIALLAILALVFSFSGCGILEAVVGGVLEDAAGDLVEGVMEEVVGSDLQDVMGEMMEDAMDEFFQDNGYGTPADEIFGEYSDKFEEGYYEFVEEYGDAISEGAADGFFGFIGDVLVP